MKSSNGHKPAERPGPAAAKPEARSRITNGKALFVGVDGRTMAARRWRDLYRYYLAETGGRHEQMVRSLASLIVRREQLDADLVLGQPVDTDELLRLCGMISRTMTKLGLVSEEPVPDATDAVLEGLRGEKATAA